MSTQPPPNNIPSSTTTTIPQTGGSSNIFGIIHDNIMTLNNSKFFAGVVMILLNVGSKFITIQFSKSTEEYLKMTVTKQILVFAMAWMGTRDIYTSLILVAVFTVLSEHLFNEESDYCIVPHEYRVLSKIIDTDGDGKITDTEINAAIQILDKANKDRRQKEQKQMFAKYGNYDFNYSLNAFLAT
jgi:hypothetical protein